MLKPITDHVSLLKKNRHIYVDDTTLTTATLAGLVASDARYLGCLETDIKQIEKWNLVVSERDWVLNNPQKLSCWIDVFKKLIPFPERGENAVRHEIYLMAFTCNIFIRDNGQFQLIKGELPSREILNIIDMELEPETFVVGFFGICDP